MFFQYNEIPDFKNNNLIKKYPHDAGWDIRSSEDFTLRPGDSIIINTKLHIGIMKGFKGIIQSRSGHAIKRSLEASNAGVLDYGYIDTMFVKLYNFGQSTQTIEFGERFCQIVFDYSHSIAPDDLKHINIPQQITELTQADFFLLKENELIRKGVGSTGRI